jgi:hypothetical protein
VGDAHPERHPAVDLFFGEVENVAYCPRSPRRKPQHRLPKRGLATPSVTNQTNITDHLRFHGHDLLLPDVSFPPFPHYGRGD